MNPCFQTHGFTKCPQTIKDDKNFIIVNWQRVNVITYYDSLSVFMLCVECEVNCLLHVIMLPLLSSCVDINLR